MSEIILSKATLSLMKELTSVENQIVIYPTGEMISIFHRKTIIGIAKIDDTIPFAFMIEDTKAFLKQIVPFKEKNGSVTMLFEKETFSACLKKEEYQVCVVCFKPVPKEWEEPESIAFPEEGSASYVCPSYQFSRTKNANTHFLTKTGFISEHPENLRLEQSIQANWEG